MSLTQTIEDINTNTNSNANYERRIMEKDKAFFDLTKTLRNMENEKEAIENKARNQECEILNLTNEISSLQSMLKIKDGQSETKEDKIKKLTQQFKAKESELINQLQLKDKKINDITNAINAQMKEYDNIINEAKKIEAQNNKIMGDCIEKDNTLKSFQTIISELKKENKQIYTLSKVLNEKEEKMAMLKQQNEKLYKENEQLSNENSQLKARLNSYGSLNEVGGGGGGVSYRNIKVNHSTGLLNEKTLIDLQNSFRNQIEQKDKYFNELNINYKQALKDNEKLIQFTINQIKQIEKALDITMTYNVITTSNTIEPLPSERQYQSNSTHPNNNNNTNNSLKYELIAKNFDLISKKVFDKLSSNYLIVEQYQNEANEIEEKYKDLQFSNEKLKQDKSSLETHLSKLNEDLKETKGALDSLNKELKDLTEHCTIIEQRLSDTNDKYSSLESGTIDFCNRCLSIIHEFLSTNEYNTTTFQYTDNIKVKEEKIIESFIMITKALIKQNNKEIELMKEAQHSNEKIEKLSNDIDQLNQQYEEMIKKTRVASTAKDEEHKKQRSLMVNKMNELSEVLEESNRMISKGEEENCFLKAKISKVEHNLQMLTCSHAEIEKTIENNNSYSNEVIKQREHKINTLLREAELKDIQIKSLEKLLNEMKPIAMATGAGMAMRSEEDLFQLKQMKGKLLSKNQYRSLLMKKGNSNNEDSFHFVPNEKNEKELKNLFQKIPIEVNTDYSCFNIPLQRGLNESMHSSIKGDNDNNSNNNNDNDIEEAKGNKSFHTAPLNQKQSISNYTHK